MSEAHLQENIQRIRERIADAARRSGRRPEAIRLVAVTKTVPVERIKQAIALGITEIGENRVQEARDKFDAIGRQVTWHMVGHLQRNKARYAVRIFDMIQSIDTLALAREVDRRAQKEDRVMPVLIEVNTSREATKFGCAPEEALKLARQVDELPHLQLQGFMTVAVFSEDMNRVRDCFKRLRDIYESARQMDWQRARIEILSMGMTHDFEVAIEEGATMVRIGTAIFGPRPG
ncbi:MAG: YggS family pyridoxal phosphate-dependent enzyme [Calditrichaeota bacterium]|nr:YggS family pyridoxal phosphate-dependent enzyme [Calditrichota bacterium]